MTTHMEGQEYDIIFAGGGTTACVAAGRLARADPSLSILIIEQGQTNYKNPRVTNPGVYLSHLLPESTSILRWTSQKSDALKGRELEVQSGGILGGGSSVNFSMYTRAQGVDYDSWNTEGWDAKSLIPLAQRAETYHIAHPDINRDVHGYSGPLPVSRGPHDVGAAFKEDFIKAVEAVGSREIVDLQDFESCDGFSRWARWESPEGVRSDAAHCYIHPLLESGEYPNLHLLLKSKVSRVVFEGTRATGVEYVPATDKASRVVIRARKLVVVSSGALGSPSILERSGVGSAERLSSLGIPVVSDLPGVGENYQDHNGVLYSFKANLTARETLDAIVFREVKFETLVEQKDSILGWNGVDIAGKIRPSEEEVVAMGPDFADAWERDFKNQKSRPVMLVALLSVFLGSPAALKQDDMKKRFLTICPFDAYPYSRGNIHIVSPDAHVPAAFNTGFLTDARDVSKHVWAYKKIREITRRSAYLDELPTTHPAFREGSKAVSPANKGTVLETVADKQRLQDIQYDKDDDALLAEHVRGNVFSTWHSLGTVKMAPREGGGCLDKHLNVHGTQGLKVADLSMCPENVGSNTVSTAIIVGEKTADIIAQELGLTIKQPSHL